MAGARSLNPPVLHTVQMLVMMIAATLAVTLLSGLAIVTEWSRFWFAVPFGQVVYADAARRLRRVERDGFAAWRIHMLIASGYLIVGGVPLSASAIVIGGGAIMGVGWSGRENRNSVMVISIFSAAIVAGGLYVFGQYETSLSGQVLVSAIFLTLVTIPVLGSLTPARAWFIDRTTRFHDSLFADLRLSELLVEIPTGYYRTGADGRLLESNPAFQAQLGRHDLQGVSHQELVAETIRAETHSADSGAMVEKVVRSYIRPDGKQVWLLESIRARVSPTGEVEGHEAITEDITAHREYEEAMDLAMSSLNVRLRYQIAIGQLARLLHLGSTSTVLPVALEPLQKATNSWLALDLSGARLVELGEPSDVAPSSVTVGSSADPSGTLWWRVADGHDGEELHDVMATVAEIIGGFLHRVSVERELQSVNEAKDQFIASVSHELRTPLTGIVGFTQYLQTSWSDLAEDDRQMLLQTLSSESLEMSAIIEDLLVATRAKLYEMDVRLEPVNARDGIHEVLRALRGRYDTTQVAVEVDENLMVMADPLRYRQIIRNLVTNAYRHGGDRIAVRAEKEDESATISVIDNGPGIPDEQREAIFTPYHRVGADRLQDSIGLGLSVSKTLAEMMGGELDYRWDGESSFDLVLKVASRDPAYIRA